MNKNIFLLDKITGLKTHPVVNPFEIPCQEINNPGLLCRHPVVSVQIATYNHKEYISAAIEGALNQKTKFEYEIVIGDDCSTDGTREICLEYQKKHPDKIRFLWSDENLFKYNGNSLRISYHCRGDYIAWCEGDDYWVDPYKLQKQYDLVVRNGAIGCVAFNDIAYSNGNVEHSIYPKCLELKHEDLQRHYFHTNTFFLNRVLYQRMVAEHRDISVWYSMSMLFCFTEYGKIVLLPDIVSVYRITMKGEATSNKPRDSHFLSLRAYVPLWLCGPKNYRGWYASQALNQLILLIRYVDEDSLAWFSGISKEFNALFKRLFWSKSMDCRGRSVICARMFRAWAFRLLRFVPAMRKRCFTNQHYVFH